MPEEVQEVMPEVPEYVVPGQEVTIEQPSEQTLLFFWEEHNTYYKLTYTGVNIDSSDYDPETYYPTLMVVGKPGEGPVTFTVPDNLPEGTTISISYHWDGGATGERPDIVTNSIASLTRTVSQNGTPLEGKTQFNIDTYKVQNESKSGLTLNYDATMDMTDLGSALFGSNSWDVLQAHKQEISDSTYVDLHFMFDKKVGLSESTLLDPENIKLESDMFVLQDNNAYTITNNVTDEKTGNTYDELTIHCRWDHDKAMSNEPLKSEIKLTGVKIALPSQWPPKDTDDNENTVENSLLIRNHGYVDGRVLINEVHQDTNTGKWVIDKADVNYADIDGGSKDDEFMLGISDKVSLPGLEKKIVENGEEKDETSVNADDTVHFKLTSNVPEDLVDYITYDTSDDVQDPSVNISPFSLGTPTEGATYKLTFLDKIDPALTINMDSIVVKLGKESKDEQFEYIELTNVDEYTIKQTADGFTITLDLIQLYEMDLIEETNYIGQPTDFGKLPIIVEYDATLGADVTNGTFINEAWVVTDHDWESSHDTVEVDTYQIELHKFERGQHNSGLQGAEFELYQKDKEGKVIEASKKTLTSNENGRAYVNGIKAGTYYIKETKAPEGYIRSDKELEVVIPGKNNVNVNDKNVVHVDFENVKVPHTGGTGTMMYTIGGVAIIVLAGVLLIVYRKSRKKQDR